MSHDLIEGDNVDVTLTIGGDEWEIIDAEIVLNTRSTPDYADVIITPAIGVPIPSTPQKLEEDGGEVGKTVSLEVNTELSARREDAEEESTIFSNWNVANMTATGEYTYEAIFHDPSQEPFQTKGSISDKSNFMNTQITIADVAEQLIQPIFPGPYEEFTIPGERKLRVSEIVEYIVSEAGIEDSVINIAEGGIVVGVTEEGTQIIKGFDPEIKLSAWETTVKDALEMAANASESRWWFDRDGVFHFGPPMPNDDIRAYSLRYITDSSDGLTTPPYQSVKVIGDGVASEDGWAKGGLISENPITSVGTCDVDSSENTLVDPVFTYRNMEINTQAEADHVREELLNKLREQQGGGEVQVVGFPEIRPHDRIDMPNTNRQPMGGESYGVLEIKHRLNTSDGFITKIKVGGPLDFQQVAELDGESVEPSEPEEEPEPAWTEQGENTTGGGGGGEEDAGGAEDSGGGFLDGLADTIGNFFDNL